MATKEKNPHLTRIGIFYDGNYFWHVSTFYYQFHERKSRLSVGGLHRFLKYQIAQLEGTSPELCKIVDAHYSVDVCQQPRPRRLRAMYSSMSASLTTS